MSTGAFGPLRISARPQCLSISGGLCCPGIREVGSSGRGGGFFVGPETKQSLENILGPLMGRPKCRVSNLGTSCHYNYFLVLSIRPISYIDFKKWPCHLIFFFSVGALEGGGICL